MAQLEKGDYYFSEQGFLVFTKQYHLKKGYYREPHLIEIPQQHPAINQIHPPLFPE